MLEYSERSEKEVFSEDELEKVAELSDASEEKIVWSKNGCWEPRGAFAFPEWMECCMDVAVVVQCEVVSAEESETVNGQEEFAASVKDIK